MAATPLKAQTTDTLFPYPQVPQDIEDNTEKFNYAVTHFWDKFAFNRPVADNQKLGEAIYDYLSFIVNANADVAVKSMDNLIERLNKEPQKLLDFAKFIQQYSYEPTGPFVTDEIYLPFAKAVAANKKIKSGDKAPFAKHVKTIETTGPKMKTPDITFTRPDGSKTSLNDEYGKFIILFFNDPESIDANLARVRLSNDLNINQRIEAGEVVVMSIYPGNATKEWKEKVANYNPSWIVGAAPNADEIYDIRWSPTIYYINPQHKILQKGVGVDALINGFRAINNKAKEE